MTPLSAVRTQLDQGHTGRTVVWTLFGLLLVVVMVSAAGFDTVLRTIGGADQGIVVVVGGLLLVAICLRGLVLWLALRAVGAPVKVGRGLVTYLAVAFINTVVPGGGAGGAPVAGLVIARSARTDVEVGVTAALTVSTLSNLMVGAFGVIGLLFLLLSGGPYEMLVLGGVGIGLFVSGLGGAVLLWRYRDRTGTALVSAVVSGFAVLDRHLPWSMPDATAVEDHAGTFAVSVERIVGGSPSQSVALLGLAAAAHLLSVLALFLAFASLDVTVSVGVLLAVIPTAVLAALTPAPGAAGGVEVALGALLSAATGHPAAAVGAAVVIYRGSGYAFRIVLGGIALVVLPLLR